MTVAGERSDDDEFHWPGVAARAAAAKSNAETVVLDVGDLVGITGSFVITSADNHRLVRAITEAVEAAVSQAGGPKPRRIEGLDGCTWVLMDYGDFVVHVFDEDTRARYDLERLWRDAPVVNWQADEGQAAALTDET
ncbi:MAG: ribosome silencing factor [Actinobacteria bacterium]|nr:ribosome silencing factor [Actinomycetota bacterium]